MEVHYLDGSFHITLAASPEGGEWRSLEMTEDYSATAKVIKHIDGAAPYLAVFPSGEIYLTYNHGGKQWGRLVSPDGGELNGYSFKASPAARSCWGASELVGSHKMLSVFPNAGDGSGRGIFIYTSYLNHRTNAKMVKDGDKWSDNTDALFVGSESQAQITQQAAHDRENIYFRINRLDNDLRDGDTVILNIGVDKNKYYSVTVGYNGILSALLSDNGEITALPLFGEAKVELFGSLNDSADTDEGAVYEITLPKAAMGLTDARSFRACPALESKEGDEVIYDTLNGVGLSDTEGWPPVILE